MRSAARGSSAASVAATLILAALGLQAWPALSLKTATFDEPAHIAAGLSYLTTGEFKINLQHPPLLKEIGALPLVLAGVRWPVSEEAWRGVSTDPDPSLQWEIGQAVLYQNDPERVMFLSRLPFLLLTIVLGWAVYAWGRRMLGTMPALMATALLAFDPSIVAHGVLVATDTGFALFVVLFLWALWEYLNHRSLKRLVVCGLALGGALGAKFSGILLPPLALLLLLLATRWIPAAVPRRSSSLVDPYAGEGGGPRIVWSLALAMAFLMIAAVVIHLLYFLPRNPFLYLAGIGRVNADHNPTYWPYMAGRFQPLFWTYYAVAYLLKEPIPAILLAALGAFSLMRRGGDVPALDRAFVVLPAVAFFAFYTGLLHLPLRLFFAIPLPHNLGFRYLIPALPCLYLAGGVGARWLWTSGVLWKRLGLTALLAWLAVGAAGIYPDHLSYFNESACLLSRPSRIGLDGGSACGPMWLDDSNVDWGQGLKQLKMWLDAEAPGRRIGLAYFGTALPQHHGLVYDRLTTDDIVKGLPPGLHAISAHLLARSIGLLGPGPGNWILRTPPRAVVGHAFYIYEVPEAP
jgi:hypothetical protein